jgi:predicted XRE-type DNA-binding protein
MDHGTLRRLARANQRASKRHNLTHAAFVVAIWEATDQGMLQRDIVKAVEISRERVRQLCDGEYRNRHEAEFKALAAIASTASPTPPQPG